MSKTVDWLAIEGAYRAGTKSLREIGAEYGVSEGAVRKRAKREAWLRDPEGTKRQMVRAALAGGTQKGTQYAERTIADEAGQDVEDMQAGLDVARACIRRLRQSVELTEDPKDIKVIAEANRVAIDTIRRIRGLDEKSDAAVLTIERAYG